MGGIIRHVLILNSTHADIVYVEIWVCTLISNIMVNKMLRTIDQNRTSPPYNVYQKLHYLSEIRNTALHQLDIIVSLAEFIPVVVV